jgi:hypothetical protein
MIVRPNTARQGAQAIPLLSKEGLGVVDREPHADAHHPLPPPPAEEGNHYGARRYSGNSPPF